MKQTQTPPTEPGKYQCRCNETDGEWYPVDVYYKLVGTAKASRMLVVDDPHIGIVGADHYADGLTDLWWKPA